ncbi:uncharacterized protein LOC100378134 [Saccoglossus kowalevskii]|uniref:Uncharacterized protein LOC100378134 isoform X2 n=1 Tax=Saccoglossus kowalevskii TaxID=10224 RepID=A0ABM0MMQ6_SACKO|nr:PREDICTED: uncharacterized protein LOC100378134 isoform X2 [Saccoglossus kowalevskii]
MADDEKNDETIQDNHAASEEKNQTESQNVDNEGNGDENDEHGDDKEAIEITDKQAELQTENVPAEHNNETEVAGNENINDNSKDIQEKENSTPVNEDEGTGDDTKTDSKPLLGKRRRTGEVEKLPTPINATENKRLPLTEENVSQLEDEDDVDRTRLEEYLQSHSLNDNVTPVNIKIKSLPRINMDDGAKREITNPLYAPPNMAHIKRLPANKNAKYKGDRISEGLPGRLPPAVMKMSTVVLSARKRAAINKGPSIYYEERNSRKLMTWDQCMNSRPPLQIDMEGPGPCTYSPNIKPLNETNSPEYSFGMKLHERSGGGYKAWSKEWFHSSNNFTHRLRFDHKWPTPATYNIKTLVGKRHQTQPSTPSFTIIGNRGSMSFGKQGSEKEPGPNIYNRDKADRLILHTAPSFTHRLRHGGTTLWPPSEVTPGPGAYNPKVTYTAYKNTQQAFTISGTRRLKRHDVGPHTTL